MHRLIGIFRSEFLLVVLASAVPVWLASAVLLYNAEIDARALVERDAAAAARAVIVAVDREVAAATALAQTINIIERIQSYARHESGELKLHKTPLDVADEVNSSVGLLEGTAKQASVEVQCQIEQCIPPLNADKVRLRQVLLNLLSNAIKFTPRGRTVTISAGQVGTDCVIRVADTGIGISAKDLSRIMQPFAQVESAQTGKSRGTGLGLPLSKGLVEQHGGSLALVSEPGVGTTVRVRLPGLTVFNQQTGVGSGGKTPGRAELARIGS